MKFCANCAAPVVKRVPPGDTLARWVCDQCGEIHYQNPKLVVGTVPEHEGRLLLCRRAIEPRYGYWTLPAGFMENDETVADAARRETLEEAGARVALGAAFSMISVPRVNQVHLFYLARVLDTAARPGEETLEVGYFDEASVPWQEIAFRTVGLTLKLWLSDRKAGKFLCRRHSRQPTDFPSASGFLAFSPGIPPAVRPGWSSSVQGAVRGQRCPRMSPIASARVLSLSRKAPRTAEVTVLAPGLRTPRMVMHRCSASTTTMTPRGCRRSIRASATCEVSRSCTWGRRA